MNYQCETVTSLNTIHSSILELGSRTYRENVIQRRYTSDRSTELSNSRTENEKENRKRLTGYRIGIEYLQVDRGDVQSGR